MKRNPEFSISVVDKYTRDNFLKWTLLRQKEQGTYEVGWGWLSKIAACISGISWMHTGSRVPICREIMSLHYKIRPLYGFLTASVLTARLLYFDVRNRMLTMFDRTWITTGLIEDNITDINWPTELQYITFHYSWYPELRPVISLGHEFRCFCLVPCFPCVYCRKIVGDK